MNILLTSVGRRAYMVKYFQKALAGTGEVHVCNSDDLTVAFQYADKSVISPLIYDKEYIPFLLEYCQKNKISVLLSLFDIDLLVLAKHKKEFESIGTKVVVSDEEFVSICNDKWETYLFLKNNGFNVPKTYLSLSNVRQAINKGEINFPVIVKPRFGCGSIAMAIAEDDAALTYLYNHAIKSIEKSYLKYESAIAEEKVIFQEFLCGQEYGADIINDLNGHHINAVIKKKIAMRAGETDIAETVKKPEIKAVAQKLGRMSHHIGNLDCDIFEVNGVPYILEMNARFGGGYPFSHVAGCDLPGAIVKWCQGEKVPNEMLSANIGVRAFKELTLSVY